MSDPLLDRKQIEELLQAAGCPDEFNRRFLDALASAPPEEQLRMLRCQRCRQLDRIHDEKKKLEDLDFLRYQLEKQSRNSADPIERGGEKDDR